MGIYSGGTNPGGGNCIPPESLVKAVEPEHSDTDPTYVLADASAPVPAVPVERLKTLS